MKKNNSTVDIMVRFFCRKLNDSDFDFIYSRVRDRKSGDLGEVISYLSKIPEMDRLFFLANNADEIFDTVDLVAKCMESDSRSKNVK